MLIFNEITNIDQYWSIIYEISWEKFKEISVELSEFMDLNGYRDISSMQGIALDSLEGLS